MRIAAKLRSSGPILHRGSEAMEERRVTATSDPSSAAPLVWTANVVFMLFCCSSFRLPIAHAAGRKMTPSGTSPVVTRRHTYSDSGEKN